LEQNNIDNKELVELFIDEVFNKHNLTAIDKYHAEKLVNDPGKTSEAIKKYLTSFFSGFPDLSVCKDTLLRCFAMTEKAILLLPS
jgi:predicted SnoaL-like aldol condensation-catalyzing enzyme